MKLLIIGTSNPSSVKAGQGAGKHSQHRHAQVTFIHMHTHAQAQIFLGRGSKGFLGEAGQHAAQLGEPSTWD